MFCRLDTATISAFIHMQGQASDGFRDNPHTGIDRRHLDSRTGVDCLAGAAVTEVEDRGGTDGVGGLVAGVKKVGKWFFHIRSSGLTRISKATIIVTGCCCEGRILMSKKNQAACHDLSAPVISDVSPYDRSYPLVRFTNALKERLASVQHAAAEVYAAVTHDAPILAQVHQAMGKGVRYVVDAKETIDAVEAGKLKLTVENGKTFAQLKTNGRYGAKLPIKRESLATNLDPVQLASSMQLMAIQDQIQGISDQLYLIDRSVHAVLDGQHNDRVGLYFSGIALLAEARGMANAELHNALIAQALRSLSESAFQLSLTMESDIRYLATGGYKAEKGKSKAAIDDRMRRINESFMYIHQAMMLKAAVYCEQGETKAMAVVLTEYSHFIETTVARNASLLAQCDVSDSGTLAGTWKKRASLKLDVSSVAEVLNTPEQTLYLYAIEEETQ